MKFIFPIRGAANLLLLATSCHGWMNRAEIEEFKLHLKSSLGAGSYRSTEVGDDDILINSNDQYQVNQPYQLNREVTYPVTVIKDEIIQFGVSNILEVFLEPEQYSEVLNHGCWCARLNPSANHDILGGNRMLDLDGDGSADDKGLDILCKEWIMARQCNKLVGGSCNSQTGTPTDDPYTIDFSHPSNYTCTDALDCQLDSCEIDAYYAFEIYNFVADHGIILYQAEEGDCRDPNLVIPPQNRECTGTVPDGLQIVIA